MYSLSACGAYEYAHGEIAQHRPGGRTVYHYTSPEGLFGILDKNSIWFTDCQFFNDKLERLYTASPLRRAVKEVEGNFTNEIETMIDGLIFFQPYEYLEWERSTTPKNNKKCGQILGRVSRARRHRYYVFCASLNSDAQNMWNYYVKNGQYLGYNLELSVDELVEQLEVIEGIRVIHGRVIYDAERQAAEIAGCLRELNEKIRPMQMAFEKEIGKGARTNEAKLLQLENHMAAEYQAGLADFLEERRLFYKPLAFAGENEYRIVLRVPNSLEDDTLHRHFRIGANGVFTPYYSLGLAKEPCPIKKITLSPMLEAKLAHEGLAQYLHSQGIYDVEIVNSDISIRF